MKREHIVKQIQTTLHHYTNYRMDQAQKALNDVQLLLDNDRLNATLIND